MWFYYMQSLFCFWSIKFGALLVLGVWPVAFWYPWPISEFGWYIVIFCYLWITCNPFEWKATVSVLTGYVSVIWLVLYDQPSDSLSDIYLSMKPTETDTAMHTISVIWLSILWLAKWCSNVSIELHVFYGIPHHHLPEMMHYWWQHW